MSGVVIEEVVSISWELKDRLESHQLNNVQASLFIEKSRYKIRKEMQQNNKNGKREQRIERRNNTKRRTKSGNQWLRSCLFSAVRTSVCVRVGVHMHVHVCVFCVIPVPQL